MLTDRRFIRLLLVVLGFALTFLIFSTFHPIVVASTKKFSNFLPGKPKLGGVAEETHQPQTAQSTSLLWDTSILTRPTFTLSRTSTATTITVTATPSSKPAEEKWAFKPTRDAQNYGLGEEQCSTTFGPLFSEISRAITYRESIGNITADEVDIKWSKGAVRAMIYDRHIYILESTLTNSEKQRMRALAVLNAINRAITATKESIPNIEFSFSISDIADPGNEKHPIWALSRRVEEEEKWIMSDFGYWSWPLDTLGEYSKIRAEIKEQETPWKSKIPKLVWRGVVGTNILRNNMLQAVKGKEWANVREIFWKSATIMMEESDKIALSMPEHCNYQFVLQTEGRSYSRLGKYLLNCHSVFISHKPSWIEPHTHLLVPSGPLQNFVQVERDFSDLEKKVQELLEDFDKAKRIADNGVKVFRDKYMTPAAQACYWRKMIRSWSRVSFEPERWETDGNGGRKMRGKPFESFAINYAGKEQCGWFTKLIGTCKH